MNILGKDALAGGLFVAVGAMACAYAASTLEMGTALRMGPGYFPFVLGLLLVGLGAAIFVTGARKNNSGVFRDVPWRAVLLIALAPIVFAVTVIPLGLIASTALACFIACFASSKVTLIKAVPLTAGLTAFCTLVFSFGLGVSMPLLGTWLR